MKLWITGGQGMLGSCLSSHCEKKQIPYVATSREQADIEDLNALFSFARQCLPTHVINCAAYTDVDGAEQNSQRAFAVNAIGAHNMAIAAKDIGAKFIHFSTDYVFDGSATIPYSETDHCNAVSVYGRSKWEGERSVLEAYPEACVIRTSWLYGMKGKNFISSILHWLNQKESIQIVADQCGRPTFAQDLAEAVFDLLDQKGIVHFANEGAVSRYQMALDIYEEAKSRGMAIKCHQIEPVKSCHFPTPANRPLYSVLNTKRYTQMTGKMPRPWKEAMGTYLDHVNAL